MWFRLSWPAFTPKLDAPPRRNSFLNLDGWVKHLPRTDVDFEYIIKGVTEGFHIVDTCEFVPAEVDNYSSVTGKEHRCIAEKQILTEISEGRYIIVHKKPVIISALGAVPKPNGGIRLIHDGSRQPKTTMLSLTNDYASNLSRMQRTCYVQGLTWPRLT